MGVNYGVNRVRFPAPVPSGSRIRGRFTVVRDRGRTRRTAGHDRGARGVRGGREARLRGRARSCSQCPNTLHMASNRPVCYRGAPGERSPFTSAPLRPRSGRRGALCGRRREPGERARVHRRETLARTTTRSSSAREHGGRVVLDHVQGLAAAAGRTLPYQYKVTNGAPSSRPARSTNERRAITGSRRSPGPGTSGSS